MKRAAAHVPDRGTLHNARGVPGSRPARNAAFWRVRAESAARGLTGGVIRFAGGNATSGQRVQSMRYFRR